MDAYRAARLARKARTKFWREHIVLAYAVAAGIPTVSYIGFYMLDREIPQWLKSIGVGPSGVKLVLGTISCGVGVWGIRKMRNYGFVVTFLYVLCFLGGLLALAKAFSFL
jgi:hypothetical protein